MSPLSKNRDGSVSLVGFPCDINSSYMQGAAEAPPLIRQALYSYASNLWTENGFDLGDRDRFRDLGDIRPGDNQSWFDSVVAAISTLIDSGAIPVSLGGDHSITYPIVKALYSRYREIYLLHFDAHPDLYHLFQDNPLSHASPFARIMEERLVRQLVQIGIRTLNRHQQDQAGKFGAKLREMKDWRPGETMVFDGPLYISFDMDVLDPGFAPGVSHQEPGGFSTREVVDIIRNIKAPEIIGADVVEYNPLRDHQGMTARVAAKIIKEICGKILETRLKSR